MSWLQPSLHLALRDGAENVSREEYLKQTRAPILLASVWAIGGLTTVVVFLRLLARKIKRVSFGVDDYMAVISLILALGCCVCSTICTHFGIGKHKDAVSLEDQTNFYKTLYAYNQIYVATGPTIKMAVLLMYRRVFSIYRFRLVVNVLLWVIGAWWLSECLTGVFTCDPISGYWDRSIDAKCYNLRTYDIQYSILNILFDVIILSLPVHMIRQLRISNRQKTGFIIVFMLGAFACVTALIRLLSSILNVNAPDFTWVYTDALIWTAIEPCVGVMSCCLPLLIPVIDIMLPDRFKIRTPKGPANPAVVGTYGSTRMRNVFTSTGYIRTTASETSSLHSPAKAKTMMDNTNAYVDMRDVDAESAEPSVRRTDSRSF